MADKYIFGYEDENKFKKLESALKKYNMLAYKKLYFEYYPALKGGSLIGEQNGDNYELKLPTDALFTKVHGDVKLIYRVDSETKTVVLLTLVPENILIEGHQSELETYKGVMLSKEHADKDKFKINLLNMIQK